MKKEFSYVTPTYSAQVIMWVDIYSDEDGDACIEPELLEIYDEEGEQPKEFEQWCIDFMYDTVYNGGLIDINNHRDYVVDDIPKSYIGRKALTEEGLEVEIIEEPMYVPICNEHHVLVIEEGRIQSDILERLTLLDDGI